MPDGRFDAGDVPSQVMWGPRRFPGINSHVLTVGPPDFRLGYGIPVDFSSIGEAMEAIPLFDPNLEIEDPNWHNPVEQWTILVTPGYYREVIRFKPFVNVVGLLKEAVIIGGKTNDCGPLGAQVYLCTRSLLSNVTLAMRGDAKPGEYAVRGYDVNDYRSPYDRGTVRFLGLSNVDFHPYPPFPPSGHPEGGGLIKFDGEDWRTVILKDVGGNYDAPDGYGIELTGRSQNADCHFINCFFNALYSGGRHMGGFVHISDCYEVHIRNSLIRVNYSSPAGSSPIAAVRTTSTNGAEDPAKWPAVLLEGTSLFGPGERVLDIGANTHCFFRHSFADSQAGDGHFIASRPDGIGDL
jgi:hypothetical protein